MSVRLTESSSATYSTIEVRHLHTQREPGLHRGREGGEKMRERNDWVRCTDNRRIRDGGSGGSVLECIEWDSLALWVFKSRRQQLKQALEMLFELHTEKDRTLSKEKPAIV